MNKKKYIYLLLFMSFIIRSTLAQYTPDNYMNRVNYIFANVDHSKVTTGLLSDYGLQVILPEYYDGTLRDSNEVDMGDGNGFQTVSWDTPCEITYLSAGNKELTIEFAFTNSG